MTENKGNKQLSFRPTPKTIERLDRMTEIRKPADTWINGRPDLTSTRADLITEYCIDGLRRDESFLKYLDEKSAEEADAAMAMMEEESEEIH